MMKRSITLGELIASGIVLGGTVLGFWINTSVRLTALEIGQKQQELNYQKVQENYEKIGTKLDKLNEGQNNILITLQNKQDRK